MMGDVPKAVVSYHKALSLRPDDALAGEMLALALADEAFDLADQLESDKDGPQLQSALFAG